MNPFADRLLDASDQQVSPQGRIELHLDGVAAASARTRWITAILTVASIITFVATWNVLPVAFLPGREQVARDAREYLLLSQSARESFAHFDSVQTERISTFLAQRDLLEPSPPLEIGVRLGPSTSERVNGPGAVGPAAATAAAASRLEGTLTIDVRQLELNAIIEELQRARVQVLTILEIPFLGIAFDVNDLATMAGLAFATIMLMKAMNRDTEYAGLQALFRHAHKTHCLAAAYDIVAMRQVLTAARRHTGQVPHGDGIARDPCKTSTLRFHRRASPSCASRCAWHELADI